MKRLILIAMFALGCVTISFVMGHHSSVGSAAPTPGVEDVSFAQDMSQHHAQAVVMSMIMLEVAPPGQVRSLAQTIALSQQQEIGVLQGWLLLWNRDTRAIATHNQMPGMASDDDVQQLRTLPFVDAERKFLILMRTHHLAGVAMAEAAELNAQLPSTIAFATSTRLNQQLEIAQVDALLFAPHE